MDNNIENKLTKSAKETIDDFSLEFKKDLMFEASKIAELKSTIDKEISLSDVLEAKERLYYERHKNDRSDNRRRRLSYMIGISGLTYAVIGLFIYVFQNKEFDFSKDLGLIIAGVGILFSLMGFFYLQTLNRRHYSTSAGSLEIELIDDNFDIVKKWQVIEKLTKDLMVHKGIGEYKSNSFNGLLAYLNHFINEEDKGTLKQLLNARNMILHHDYKLEKKDKIELLNFSKKIITKLEKELEDSKRITQ